MFIKCDIKHTLSSLCGRESAHACWHATVYMFVVHPYILCRAKHPVKVHVWARISHRGQTGICVWWYNRCSSVHQHSWEDAASILALCLSKRSLSDAEQWPKAHFQPVCTFLCWEWCQLVETPSESPVARVERKYQRRQVKSKTKDELVSGILEFWNTVDVAKCKKYRGFPTKW